MLKSIKKSKMDIECRLEAAAGSAPALIDPDRPPTSQVSLHARRNGIKVPEYRSSIWASMRRREVFGPAGGVANAPAPHLLAHFALTGGTVSGFPGGGGSSDL